jgi:glycosyltransferase involved in cell wall biosynthesis
MMRIVLGAHHYPPRHIAGVELITERLARRLAGRGHQVEVVCVEEIDAAVPISVATEIRAGVPVHRLGLQLSGQPVGLGVRYRDDLVADWFAAYLGRLQPDIFHGHGSYLLSASPIEMAARAKVKTVITLHDYWFLCPRITLLHSDGQPCATPASPTDCAWCMMGERRRFRALAGTRRTGVRRGLVGGDGVPWRWMVDAGLVRLMEERQRYLLSLLQTVDAIISPAPLAGELLVARGLPAERVRRVAYGLDVAALGPARRPERVGPLRIGYLGQIAPHKGVHLLVQAVKSLLATAAPAMEVAIHGDPGRFPDYARRLQRDAAGLSTIRFLGAYDNARVADILADLDVVVVPSTWFEVSPLVILEAFARGVPVVASRHTNLASLVRDEYDGLLFTPGDATDLARHLRRLLDEPGLHRRLTEGIRPVRPLDAEVDDLERLYTSLLTPSVEATGTARINGSRTSVPRGG